MEMIISVLVKVHVLTGIIALISGFFAVVSRKGRTLHRRSGQAYFYSMIFVAFTGITLSVIAQNALLLVIGIFSFYLNWAGMRSVKNKSLKANFLDWLIWGLGILTAAVMIRTMHPVLLVFGGLFAFLTIRDLIVFRKAILNKKLAGNLWLIRHIGMMTGAYIATITAFVVTSVGNISPNWLPWLLPTMLGTPFIAYWTRKIVTKKFQV